MRLQIIAIETDWDMHQKTSLRESYKAARLKPGQCLVAFNNSYCPTMARIIDYEGGVHDYYTPRSNPFDIALLAVRIRGGMGTIIETTTATQKQLDQAHETAVQTFMEKKKQQAPKPRRAPQRHKRVA